MSSRDAALSDGVHEFPLGVHPHFGESLELIGARQKGDSKWEKPVSAKICGFLWFPAKICGFQRFSAQICDSQIS